MCLFCWIMRSRRMWKGDLMPSISRSLPLWQRVFVYALLLFILASIQVDPGLWTRFSAPDFLLFLPLVIGLTRGGREGFAIGLIAGFLRDYLGGRLYGLGMLEGMIIGLIAGLLFSDTKRVFWRRFLLAWPALTLSHELLMLMLSYFFPLDRSLPLSFASILRSSAERLPYVLLANMFAAVLILFFLWLGFYHKKKREKSGISRGI